jgi:hypothetical protein
MNRFASDAMVTASRLISLYNVPVFLCDKSERRNSIVMTSLVIADTQFQFICNVLRNILLILIRKL